MAADRRGEAGAGQRGVGLRTDADRWVGESANLNAALLFGKKGAQPLEAGHYQRIGLATPLLEHFEIVREHDEMLSLVVGRCLDRVAQFGKTAGTDLSWSELAKTIPKNGQGQDANLFEFQRVKKTKLLPQIDAAVRKHGVKAAVDADTEFAEGAIGVVVAGKTTRAKGFYGVASGLREKAAAQSNQRRLLVARVVPQVLPFPRHAGKGQGLDFVGPFWMQVEFDIVIPRADEVNDSGKRFNAEARREQWFDKENSLQAMAIEDVEGFR